MTKIILKWALHRLIGKGQIKAIRESIKECIPGYHLSKDPIKKEGK
jgi:hypothetical protein